MRYEAPDTAEAAASLLASAGGDARVLAGGTDLLVQLRSGVVEPELVVDVKRIGEMRTIEEEDGGFRVGAALCGAELGEHDGLSAAWPGVVEAAELIGSTQIQGRATLGGNLCNASPAADTVPALFAAGAICSVVGPNGRRDVAVQEIITGPGLTSLEKGEIVASILLPARPAKSADAYLRFIPRTEMDIAVVGAGVSLTLGDDGTIKEACVALGAVAPTAVFVPKAAEALIGSKAADETLEKVAAEASAVCNPIDDKRGTVEYRTHVAGVLAKRAAKIAFERAGSK